MQEMKKKYSNGKFDLFRAVLPPIGVNTYFIFSKKTLIVIDPGIGVSELINKDIYKRKNNYILLTHTHYDHIAGINELEFPIIVSKEAYDGLFKPKINLSESLFSTPFKLKNNNEIICLDEGTNTFGEIDFNSQLFPGHTQGDMIFDFGDVIFSEDVIFKDSIGRTDFPFSNSKNMLKSISKLKSFFKTKNSETLVFPGHMLHDSVGNMLKKNPYLI